MKISDSNSFELSFSIISTIIITESKEVHVMTLQQLRYMIKVVESGSITEAAKKLYITQPSLSNAIRELEDEFGIEIFLRSAKGITLTNDGSEFLSYARQIIEQSELLEQRYKGKKTTHQQCSISTQHYAFSVHAFVDLVKESNADEYVFTLRETRTYDIIEDVQNLRSELGILYLNDVNEPVIRKLLKEKQLTFHPLFKAKPHVFIHANHPLATKQQITLEDLEDYPCLSFEQGEYNSFYFSEEILSTVYHKKCIHVSDRATLFNLLIGLDGYTICTGILNADLNGNDIISIPLQHDDNLLIGWITKQNMTLTHTAEKYIQRLKELIIDDGYEQLST